MVAGQHVTINITMNILVIYPGRFHPFHRGHKASYDYLTNQFGANNVYIATSDVQAPATSPFSYSDKVAMMTKLGIPAGHVVKVKNPYQATEITSSLPDEEKRTTALIFAVSEKDRARFTFAPKKDGTASYLQPLPEDLKQLQPMTEHGYVTVVPTVDFRVRGQSANSASEIRKMYIKGSAADRAQIVADLYGEAYPELIDIFDQRLGTTNKVEGYMIEARQLKTAAALAWMQKVIALEQQALHNDRVLIESVELDRPDYINERR